MQTGPEQRLPCRIVTVLALYLIVGGVISFGGWVFNIPRLSDWAANGTAIQPNSTIAAVLAGVALIFAGFLRSRLSLITGGFVGLIGLATVFQFVTGIDLRIDTLFLFGREWGSVGF